MTARFHISSIDGDKLAKAGWSIVQHHGEIDRIHTRSGPIIVYWKGHAQFERILTECMHAREPQPDSIDNSGMSEG